MPVNILYSGNLVWLQRSINKSDKNALDNVSGLRYYTFCNRKQPWEFKSCGYLPVEIAHVCQMQVPKFHGSVILNWRLP